MSDENDQPRSSHGGVFVLPKFYCLPDDELVACTRCNTVFLEVIRMRQVVKSSNCGVRLKRELLCSHSNA